MVGNKNGIVLPNGWLMRAQDTLRSHIRVNEVLFVYGNLKPVLRWVINKNDTQRIQSLIAELGLFSVISPFSLTVQDNDLPYSNKGARDEHGSHCCIYIAHQEGDARDAMQAEVDNDHVLLGTLLGYPKCCIQYFVDHIDASPNKDLALVQLANDKDYYAVHFGLNTYARYFDFALLSHFVCSPSCKASLDIAVQHYKLLKTLRPKYCTDLVGHLTSPVVFEPPHTFHMLESSKVSGSTIHFSNIKSTQKTALSQKLARSRHVHLHNDPNLLKDQRITFIVPCKNKT